MNKKNWSLLFCIVAVLLTSATVQTEFPQAEISNGIIHARFYLPDAEKGYYRSTRFDWSGNMPDLEYKGHTYCSQWFDNYNPITHDAIMGPVESFSPLGYEEAKPGGHFVQIGVGVLSKLQDDKYSPFKYYPILNAGIWKLKQQPSSLTFTHTLQDSLYSYEYIKTETLVKGKPILVIAHSLTNTGKQTIETNVYNHNLFVMDKQPTGPGFTVTFPFNVTGIAEGQKGFGTGNLAEIKENKIVFSREFAKRESVYSVMQGYGKDSKDYDIKIENHKTGAAVRITSDQPLSKLVFWGSSTIFSPEPYIQMSVDPGKTFNWKILYEFYTCAITN
ncbi:MAG: hypothetical protein ABJC98_03275 [Bacteroidota bacterium]